MAAAPAYIKLDSSGEYIFDYNWADAHQRLLGRSYYPKLQLAVPFSPVPGPRLLLHPSLQGQAKVEAAEALLRGCLQIVERNQLSSVHLTFCLPWESQLATSKLPYLSRLGEQYHWLNRGYANFEEFLAELSSRKRKAIRRERRIAASHPLTIHTVSGEEASCEHWDALYAMYRATAATKWGRPYLNRAFFSSLSQRLADRVVLFLVQKNADKRWVAGAWNLRGSRTLFGRNWGCLEQYDMLHFEVCYYRAIDYAISHRLERVEAGAQGIHKIQRGYQPVAIHSAHHLADPSFAEVVADYLRYERAEQHERLALLDKMLPFRQEAL